MAYSACRLMRFLPGMCWMAFQSPPSALRGYGPCRGSCRWSGCRRRGPGPYFQNRRCHRPASNGWKWPCRTARRWLHRYPRPALHNGPLQIHKRSLYKPPYMDGKYSVIRSALIIPHLKLLWKPLILRIFAKLNSIKVPDRKASPSQGSRRMRGVSCFVEHSIAPGTQGPRGFFLLAAKNPRGPPAPVEGAIDPERGWALAHPLPGSSFALYLIFTETLPLLFPESPAYVRSAGRS